MEIILNNGKRIDLSENQSVETAASIRSKIGAASAVNDGYLSHTDYVAFLNSIAGEVTTKEITLGVGKAVLITQAQHGLNMVRDIKVFNPTKRAHIDVYYEIKDNKDVLVAANIDLNNYILKIF